MADRDRAKGMANFIPKLKQERSPDGQDGRLELGIREESGEQHQELEGPPLYICCGVQRLLIHKINRLLGSLLLRCSNWEHEQYKNNNESRHLILQ